MTTLRYMGVMNTIRRDPEIAFRALRSFLRQNPTPEKVFFIDQNNVKMTLPSDLAQDPKIIHHHQIVPSVGLARNLVPQDPDVDWLVFCDDDGFLADDYVEKLQEILQKKPQLELVAGPYINDTDGEFYSFRHKIGGRLDTVLGSKLLLGSNISIRPKTFNRIGRYDPRFGPGAFWPSSDETDLVWKALVLKVPMQYSPDVRVFHPPPYVANTEEAIQKAYRYARGKGALSAKWIFEKHHLLGYWEFIEMTVLPFVNMARGIIRGEFRQIRIQSAMLKGRYKGFFEFIRLRGKPS